MIATNILGVNYFRQRCQTSSEIFLSFAMLSKALVNFARFLGRRDAHAGFVHERLPLWSSHMPT
jgi:hypothetical protein